MNRIREARGFMAIEILIVVIILGILAAIGAPQFSSASTPMSTGSVSSFVEAGQNPITADNSPDDSVETLPARSDETK